MTVDFKVKDIKVIIDRGLLKDFLNILAITNGYTIETTAKGAVFNTEGLHNLFNNIGLSFSGCDIDSVYIHLDSYKWKVPKFSASSIPNRVIYYFHDAVEAKNNN